jgi:hypothetical protein
MRAEALRQSGPSVARQVMRTVHATRGTVAVGYRADGAKIRFCPVRTTDQVLTRPRAHTRQQRDATRRAVRGASAPGPSNGTRSGAGRSWAAHDSSAVFAHASRLLRTTPGSEPRRCAAPEDFERASCLPATLAEETRRRPFLWTSRRHLWQNAVPRTRRWTLAYVESTMSRSRCTTMLVCRRTLRDCLRDQPLYDATTEPEPG